ncbi:phage tail length tape measure family protein [Mesorhizobium sp. B4-1-4]|uniref:phage tail length tape measure family protein n=1 Tax=Mesorhizobium sp. B4-1-4 TaxID=2589888 RepID=UPI001AED7490|nr:phage tail length tape measure family protein [Mesorhizobium sp. B4-1-4]UCI30506.1 phage tail length tape measure family protein [Mesorhizobium sp. B4-1-4]
MDIAEIGFKADTSDLVDAKVKLEAIVPAAGKAARGSDIATAALDGTASAAQRAAVGAAGTKTAVAAAAAAINTKRTAVVAAASADTKAAGAAEAAAAATTAQGEAADAAAAKLKRMQNAANQNSASLGAMKANTANIAAQFQDIGVTAAMGMNPLQIALQQGTQLSSVFAAMKPAEAVKALGSAFGSLFGVVSLVTIGLVAIIAALVQFVNWAKFAKTALNDIADILPTIAPYLVIIGGAMLLAFGPAILGAISAVSGAVLSLSAYLIGLAIGWAAANPATAIILGFALVLVALNIFRDEIAKVLGFDLVGVVKDTVNYIVGGFVGTYKAVVAVWDKLPDAFADLGIRAANALISGIQSAIDKSVQAMRGLWNWMADHDPTGMMSHNNDTSKVVDLKPIKNNFAGAAAGMADTAKTAYDSAQGVDYVGAAYEFTGKLASGAAQKVRDLASAIDLTDAKKKKHGGKTEAEKFSDIVNGAERSIATLQAERDAIGLSEIATAKLKYETQLLNEAKQKNISLSPSQRAQLIGLADDMASLEVQTKKVKEAFEFAKDLTKGFFSDFEQGIVNGEGFWKSFGDAALNALNKIVDKLLNDVIDALFQVNSAASGGGSGIVGFLGSLFGGGGGYSNDLGGLTDFMSSLGQGGVATSNGLSKFAKGGDFTNSIVSRSTPFKFANGTALGEMGEAGPEAVMPLKRMGNGDLGVQVAAPAANDTAANNNGRVGQLNVNVSGARGNAEIKEMVRQGVEDGISQYDTYALPIRVNEIGSDPRAR